MAFPGFLYVGTDEDDNSILTYVLESPKLQLNNDATLYFDLYRRSKDITLQVCFILFRRQPGHPLSKIIWKSVALFATIAIVFPYQGLIMGTTDTSVK